MFDLKMELPEHFLEEETRCGYTIPREMKKAWAVEMDLLMEFVRVCEKHHLQYYAMGGTLLGAVRHHGFIPWDDDIDLLMPRKDYNKLLAIGAEEFHHPYFMSCPATEYKFWRTHVQIRNSETTGAIKDDEARNNNKGIFIDIFVLDVVPDTKEERLKHRKEIKDCYWIANADMNWVAYKANHDTGFLKSLIKNCYFKLLVNDAYYKRTFKKYNALAGKYQDADYQSVAHTSLIYDETRVWNKSDFEETEQVDFEFLKITIPKGYHHILSVQYGDDYMSLPKKIIPTTHGGLKIDTEKPYTYYYKNNQKENEV